MLLKRAFWNCSELQLISLDGGLSGAPVFKAYASLDAGLVQQGATGAYPHLYFVKDRPAQKNRRRVRPVLWPHIRICALSISGHGCAAIAATSDQPKEFLWATLSRAQSSLIACARGGRCGHAIANLFDKTLGGWRKQQRVDTKFSLSSYLEKKWCAEGQSQLIALPPERIPTR